MATKIQAILGRDVPHLGLIGDLVNVAPGHLRNYLLPKGLAFPVSKSRIKELEHQKRIIEHRRNRLKALSAEMRDRIEVQKFVFEVKAGEQGKLFGSVGTKDIETKLIEAGFNIYHKDIKLEGGPLKTVGIHEIPVRLEGGVMAKVKVVLAAKVEEKPVNLEENEDYDNVQENNYDDENEDN